MARSIKTRNGFFFAKDNGIGLEPDHQEKIFGLFDKLDLHTEGTGVALARRIVEVHGGRGGTFYFTLPVKEEKL